MSDPVLIFTRENSNLRHFKTKTHFWYKKENKPNIDSLASFPFTVYVSSDKAAKDVDTSCDQRHLENDTRMINLLALSKTSFKSSLVAFCTQISSTGPGYEATEG